MKKLERIFSVVMVLLILLMLPYTSVKGQVTVNSLHFINETDKKVSFRFEFINNLMIIPVIVNDSDTLKFILDSGINTSIISELSLGDNLSLNYARQVKLKGLGSGESIDALVSSGNFFSIPGVTGSNQQLYVLLQNIFNLSSILGTRVHGLIGYNLFSSFVVEINYPKRVITLYNPVYYTYKTSRRSRTLPLVISNSKPFIYGTVKYPGQQPVRVKLMLDTGASHALWLLPGSDEHIYLPDKNVDTFLGTGLNGKITGKLARIETFQLGSYTFDRPVVAFPDTVSIRYTGALGDRNGSLGAEILKRFDVILDYPNHLITLKPNKYYREPFRVNHSGIEIIAPIPGFPYYTISDVRKDSPGDKAGLKRGDALFSVDYKNVKNMKIDEIYRILQGHPGRIVKIVVLRKGFHFVTFLRLQELI